MPAAISSASSTRPWCSGSQVVNAYLTPTATHLDRIDDFSAVDDTMRLENAIFTAVGAPGTLAAAAFRTGTVARDASDRLLYDPAGGGLFYDADGTGAIAAVQFAQLTPGLTLTAADFHII